MKYSEFQPTGFDARGLALPDRQDWLVLPVSRNRDSDCLAESNFDVALELLGGESETVEIHRFGHWACGWFEIILAAPQRESLVYDIESSLAGYPVLDDSDYSRREWNKASEWWDSCGLRERIRICSRFRTSIFAARRDEIPENVDIGYLADGN